MTYLHFSRWQLQANCPLKECSYHRFIAQSNFLLHERICITLTLKPLSLPKNRSAADSSMPTEGEITRDIYHTHTESFSIQLKNPTPKSRGRRHKRKIKANQVLAQQTNTHIQPFLSRFWCKRAWELFVERFIRVVEAWFKPTNKRTRRKTWSR